MPVYASHAHFYKAAGWPCVLPLPPNAKKSPPEGYTGNEGRDETTIQEMTQFAHALPDGNIALRLPAGVVGIDVDHYDKVKVVGGRETVVQKRGGDVIAELETRLGPLPPTWRSSARAWPTGIRFYRVPIGKYRTTIGDAIEVIQRHHRYAVVWPSTNPEAEDATYKWWHAESNYPVDPPRVNELPELPEPWVAFLREGAAGESTELGAWDDGRSMLAALSEDARPHCADMRNAVERALRKMRDAAEGSRHDAMTQATHDVVHVGAKGHPGAAEGLRAIAELWAGQTAGEERDEEMERALLGSARKAVTLVGRADPVNLDPCLLVASSAVPTPAPADHRPAGVIAEQGPLVVVEQPATPWSARMVIGAHPFDPREALDQGIADRALERLYPALRYAADVGAWLIRRPDRWELAGASLERWGLRLLAELMPAGDPEADKDSDEYRRARRRARMMTGGSAGVGGVAAKMRDAVMAVGEHPAAVRLADLDADPEVLWAGGVPWNLRRAEPAQWLPPDTPHLHSCAVAPAETPTPRWDAFLRAVLPDAEVRAWALRVLGVALTGHADRALPILWGDKARGKTQLVKLVMSLLGSYAHAADPRLLSNPDGTHASIVYALKGRRLSFIDEGPRRGEQATERLKQITGGGELTGNPMRGNPVSFAPTHTLVLTANEPPGLVDEALRDRVRLIPCEGDPAEVARARAAITGEAWQQEAPGALLALMREAAAWLGDPRSAHGDAGPGRVRGAVAEIAAEQDPIAGWLADAVVPLEQGTRAAELYQSFVAWCRGMGHRNAPNITRWGRALTAAGYPPRDREDGRYRPLAPRGWGGPPRWPGTYSNESNGSPSGGLSGGSLGSSQTNPPAPVFPVQPPLSSVVLDSLDSTYRTLEESKHTEEDQEGAEAPREDHAERSSTEKSRERPSRPSKPSSRVGLTSEDAPGQSPSGPPRQPSSAEGGSSDRATKPRSEPVVEARTAKTATRPRTRMTEEERAARAAERKRVRDEAREAARRVAIEAAAGPVVGLPAIVRRGAEPEALDVPAAAAELARQITARGELSVDTESTGYPVGHRLHALRTVQLGGEDAAVVLDAEDPAQRALAAAALGAAPMLRAFSASADLVPLACAGLVDAEDAWRRMHDVTIPAKLDSPAGVQNGSDLKSLAARRLGDPQSPAADEAREALFKAGGWASDVKDDKPFEKSGWAQVDHRRRTMVRYDASDVLDCAALARALPAPPAEVYERERRVEQVVSRIAHVGLPLDRAHIEELIPREEAALADARARLLTRGVDNGKSSKQVGEWLTANGVALPLTDNGNPSTREGVLENRRHVLPDDSPARAFIADVLDYREHATALGLFLYPWRELCARGDGRTRSTVYTLGAATGRMSCVRFNLQQITREGGYRACILADPGYLFVSADFSSVEVRVMAALSGDPVLRELVRRSTEWEAAEHAPGERNPYDLHNVVAEMAFGPGWTKRDRYMVKRGVFGWAYGGGISTLAAQVGCGESIMGAIVDSLATIAPGYVQWSDEVKLAVRRGAVEFPTYAGRVIKLDRRFPHKAPNYLIQGTARELLVDALLRWDGSPFGGGVVVPVHDEILAMVPAEQAGAATEELVRCMRAELHGVDIAVGAGEPSAYWQDAA